MLAVVATTTVAIGLSGAVAQTAGAAVVPTAWSPAEIFTPANPVNPSPDSAGDPGVWTLAQGNGPEAGAYQPLTTYTGANCGIAGYRVFSDPSGLPLAGFNGSGQNITDAAGNCSTPFTIPAGGMVVHPMSKDAVIIWTAPVSGPVSVTGMLRDADISCGDGVTWQLSFRDRRLSVAAPLTSGSLGNGGTSTIDAAAVHGLPVVAGDQIILSVGAGGNTLCDLTGVDLRIAADTNRIVTSPDYKIVRYIRSFNVASCAYDLARDGVSGGAATCTAIWLTRNPEPNSLIATPPEYFWNGFLRDKEYRSIVHLPSYRIICGPGGSVVNTATTTGIPQLSAGFTPLRTSFGTKYVAGEKYQDGGGIWYDVSPKIALAPDRKSVHVVYRVAARAGTAENSGSPVLSGYTLPFVWTMIQVDLRCDGTTPAAVTYSQLPSIKIFRDGEQVLHQVQSSDWGGFIKSGGRTKVSNGHGNLFKPCRVATFGGASTGAKCDELTGGKAPFPL